MATHHITEKMVADKPAFTVSQAKTDLLQLLQALQSIVIAHNAEYDLGMLVKEGVQVPKHICTLKISRALDTEGEMVGQDFDGDLLYTARHYLNL